MQNPIVDFLKQHIGIEMTDSPSPYARWLKGKLVDIDEGLFVAEYVVREDMCNPSLNIHGGVAAGILDEIIGAAVFTLNNEHYFTSINLNCDFLSPAKMGETVVARAHVVRKGRNIIHVEGTIKHLDGKLVAKASSNLGITPNKVA